MGKKGKQNKVDDIADWIEGTNALQAKKKKAKAPRPLEEPEDPDFRIPQNPEHSWPQRRVVIEQELVVHLNRPSDLALNEKFEAKLAAHRLQLFNQVLPLYQSLLTLGLAGAKPNKRNSF